MDKGLHIEFAAAKLGNIGGIPITNTLVSSWLVMGVLLLIAVSVGRKITVIPGKVQNFFEMVFDGLLGYMEDVLGSRKTAVRFFPFIATVFLFIAASNLFDFMPFFGSVGFHKHGEFIPLFRPINADLNVTLALAIVAVITIEASGIQALGFFGYLAKYFNIFSPLKLAIGVIEFISSMSRLISFSFRLFGNIFAGEVLIAVVAFFVPYILPIPLMMFESFVGILQATVFAMLSLFFIKLSIAEPHGSH